MDWRRFLIIPPILIGIAIFYFMTWVGDDGNNTPPTETAIAVRVTKLQPTSFEATASGFGRVVAQNTWQAISQVDGRVVEMADELAIGRIIKAGTVIVKIDPRTYEIAKAKAEANVASAKSQLTEIDEKEKNSRASLKLENEIEEFLQKDFTRKAALVKSKTLAQATLDQSNRELLSQQKKVLDLKNTLALFPVQRISLKAAMASRQAELEEAERNLQNAVISAPLTGRVTEKNLAVGQYARPGDKLVSMENISASEIVAEFQPSSLSRLVRALLPENEIAPLIQPGGEAAIGLLKNLGIKARVESKFGDRTFQWPAQVMRQRGSADSATGALGIVVRVEKADQPDPAKRRPPLNNGTFVEVILSAPEKEDLLIARDAVHIGKDGKYFVYVIDDDQRLRRRDFVPGPAVGDALIIREGIKSGETIVLSNPQPAIIGMKLTPIVAPLSPGDKTASSSSN